MKPTKPANPKSPLRAIIAQAQQPPAEPKPEPKIEPEPEPVATIAPEADVLDDEIPDEEITRLLQLRLLDDRADSRESRAELYNTRRMLERAERVTGFWARLLSLFTFGRRLQAARHQRIERMLLAVLGDREAATENAELAERVAELEDELADLKERSERDMKNLTDRCLTLKMALSSVHEQKALSLLASVVAGRVSGSEEATEIAVSRIATLEQFVGTTLAMDDEAWGIIPKRKLNIVTTPASNPDSSPTFTGYLTPPAAPVAP